MESSIKEEKGLKRKLEFVIPLQAVEDCFSKNYQKIQKEAKISGFRQGKAPLQKVKQLYKNQAHKAVMDELFKAFYPQALKAQKIFPVASPTLIDLDLKEDQPGRFLLELEVHPEVKVENYKSLNLKKKNTDIQEKEVSATIENLRQSYASFEDSKNQGPVKKGDFLTVDVEGLASDKSQKPFNYPNLLVEVGRDSISPDFDTHLIGMSESEKKEFDFHFPKDHPNPEVAGRLFHIKIQLKNFKDKKLPELNDEFAKRFKMNSLKELRSRVETDLKKNLEQKVKEEMENAIVEQLVEKNPVDLPESLIQEQKQKLKANARKRLEEYKMSSVQQEAFLTEKDSEFEKEAKTSLHASYLVEKLVQDLKMKATEEDIQNSLKENFPSKKPEEMERELKKGRYWDNFVFNLTRKKVISYLIDQARVGD